MNDFMPQVNQAPNEDGRRQLAAMLARHLCSNDLAQKQAAWDFAWSKRTYEKWEATLRLMVYIQ